jgi:hypothetical protein
MEASAETEEQVYVHILPDSSEVLCITSSAVFQVSAGHLHLTLLSHNQSLLFLGLTFAWPPLLLRRSPIVLQAPN